MLVSDRPITCSNNIMPTGFSFPLTKGTFLPKTNFYHPTFSPFVLGDEWTSTVVGNLLHLGPSESFCDRLTYGLHCQVGGVINQIWPNEQTSAGSMNSRNFHFNDVHANNRKNYRIFQPIPQFFQINFNMFCLSVKAVDIVIFLAIE